VLEYTKALNGSRKKCLSAELYLPYVAKGFWSSRL